MTRLALRPPFPDWHSGVRRRVRSVLRVYGSAGRRHFLPGGAIVPAYWWDGTPNFGDALTPWLLPRYGLTPVHAAPEAAVLCGAGSILEQLPSAFNGMVWGSGLLHGRAVELPHARFGAVRGSLTRDLLDLPATTPLGDPGLLVGRHLPRQPPRWRLAVVPHHAHLTHPDVRRLAAEPGAVAVDVTRGPRHVLRRIAACEAVLSTSLHGVVVADSLGIPAAWAVATPALFGGEFKFRDHETVALPSGDRRLLLTARTSVTEILRTAGVADAQRCDAAATALERLLTDVAARPGVPALAWRYR